MKIPNPCSLFCSKIKTLSRNRLKKQGVDCTGYRPAPENCQVKNDSANILYKNKNNHSASSSNLQNFSGSHNSTLQQTLDEKNSRTVDEVEFPCSPVKGAKSIENLSKDQESYEYRETQDYEQEYQPEEEHAKQQNDYENYENYQNHEEYQQNQSENHQNYSEHPENYETPEKCTNYDQEIEQAFTFEAENSESPAETLDTATSNTVTPQHLNQPEQEMSFKFEFAECSSKQEPDTFSESLTDVTNEKPSSENFKISSGFSQKIESSHYHQPEEPATVNQPKRMISPKSTRSLKLPLVQNPSYEQQILKIEDSIKIQERIEAQTNKSINMGSKKEDVNSRLILEAERVLLKAQRTTIALFRRKEVLRTALNRSLGGESLQKKKISSGNTNLSLGSIVFKTYQIGRLTKRTYSRFGNLKG